MKVSVSFLSSKDIPRDLRLLNDTDAYSFRYNGWKICRK